MKKLVFGFSLFLIANVNVYASNGLILDVEKLQMLAKQLDVLRGKKVLSNCGYAKTYAVHCAKKHNYPNTLPTHISMKEKSVDQPAGGNRRNLYAACDKDYVVVNQAFGGISSGKIYGIKVEGNGDLVSVNYYPDPNETDKCKWIRAYCCKMTTIP